MAWLLGQIKYEYTTTYLIKIRHYLGPTLSTYIARKVSKINIKYFRKSSLYTS